MLTASEGSASIEAAGDSAGGGRRGRSAFRRYAFAPLLSLAAAAAVLVSLLVANGSANASAVTQSFGLKLDANAQGGAAASGTVTFTGDRSFSYNGSFRMICAPGQQPGTLKSGAYAYVWVELTFVNGTAFGWQAGFDQWCGPETHGFAYSGSYTKRIASVQVMLRTSNREDRSTAKDNPYT